jgi:hypothetical protein
MRFLDNQKGWKENDEEPIGIPGQHRKGGKIFLTPNLGENWVEWDGKPVNPAFVNRWPKGMAAPVSGKNGPPSQAISSGVEVEPKEQSTVTAKASGVEHGSLAAYFNAVQPYKDMALMNSLVTRIMSFLTPVELMGLRQLTKADKQLADKLIWGLMTKVAGMSSFQGAMGEQIKSAIQVGAGRIKLAADQVDLQEVEHLLAEDPYLKRVIWINYGQNLTGTYRDQKREDAIKPGNVQEASGPTSSKTSKMHNKYIVQGSDTRGGAESGNESVITGSANMTYSGQNLNTESMIYLKNPIVAAYFSHYFNLISKGTKVGSKEGQQFAKLVKRFNAEENRIRMAMEPFVNINDFVKTELKGADEVVVRMFVLSVFGRDNAVDALCKMAQAGVTVSVVVDVGQYEQDYVREAVDRLKAARATVNLQQSPGGKIMHDKMILAHFPKTKEAQERHTVMVGSSGFTKNVYQHMNYENMVAVDDQGLYRYFMDKHHLESLRQKINFPPK